MFNLTPMVRNLLLINVGVFFLGSLLRIDLNSLLGLRYIHSEQFNPVQIFAYMFLHGGFRHLFGNMIGLFFFGTFLERFLGPQRFLILYLVCGIGGGVLFGIADYIEKRSLERDHSAYLASPDPDSFGVYVAEYATQFRNYEHIYQLYENYYDHPNSIELRDQTVQVADDLYKAITNVPLVGASGAVLGILMAMALLFPNTEVYLLFFPFPIKMKYLALAYAAFDIYSEINRTPGDSVAHLAHLGGMVAAFFLVKYWQKNSKDFF